MRENLGLAIMEQEGVDSVHDMVERLATIEGSKLLTDDGMFLIPNLYLLSHFSETIR